MRWVKFHRNTDLSHKTNTYGNARWRKGESENEWGLIRAGQRERENCKKEWLKLKEETETIPPFPPFFFPMKKNYISKRGRRKSHDDRPFHYIPDVLKKRHNYQEAL